MLLDEIGGVSMEFDNRVEEVLNSASLDIIRNSDTRSLISNISNEHALWEDLPDLLCCFYIYGKYEDHIMYDFGDGFFLDCELDDDADYTLRLIHANTVIEIVCRDLGLFRLAFDPKTANRLSAVYDVLSSIEETKHNIRLFFKNTR